ncbi:MAG: cytochrome c-type biogenesis protein CcmH [Nitrosospira sp.]|nr:cytochrome c-type biogenesis protein CcmH [Nitrosospira sp.]
MSLSPFFGALVSCCGQQRAGLEERFFSVKIFALLLALMLVLPSSWAKEAALIAEDPEIERRMIHLSEDLRCLVCQNESLAGSRADFANDLRREIREQMKDNKSDKEIIDFMVARYGDFVLYRPPVKATTILLWFGPFVFLAAGAILLLFYLKRRRRQIEDPALSEKQRQQAEALLKDGKGNNA